MFLEMVNERCETAKRVRTKLGITRKRLKISESKRDRILAIATTESRKGFKGANINEIARKANISIGSMYTYFETKENLYLTVIDESTNTRKRDCQH